jgi:hypothetical protein
VVAAVGASAVIAAHKRLLRIAQERDMDTVVWRMLCILESIHGLEYAERAAREWPTNALRGQA